MYISSAVLVPDLMQTKTSSQSIPVYRLYSKSTVICSILSLLSLKISKPHRFVMATQIHELGDTDRDIISVLAGNWVEHSVISLRLWREVNLKTWSEQANTAPSGNKELFSVISGTVFSADTQLASGIDVCLIQ